MNVFKFQQFTITQEHAAKKVGTDIDLLTSIDLIHWQSTTIDYRQWQPSVVRVWAPLVI